MGTMSQAAVQPMATSGNRVLGNILAAPRQLYFTLIPAALGFTGVICWVIGNDAGLVLGACVAAFVAFFTLWDWLFRKAPTRFSTLLAMTELMGYGFGAVNTWLTLPRQGLTLTQYYGLREGVLARGIGAVLFSAAALYFLGEIFEKPLFGREFQFQFNVQARGLVYLGTLIMMSGYLTHSLAFEGATASGGHLSVFGAFLFWLYPPLVAFAVSGCVTAPRGMAKIASGICALILMMMFSFMGRRVAIYSSVEIILMLSLVGYRWRGGNYWRKFFLISGLAIIVVACSLTFMLFRIAAGYEHSSQSDSVALRVHVAGQLIQKGGAYAMAAQESQQNAQSRTFILPFLANVMDASFRMTPALGRDAETMFLDTVPRIIYPEKSRFVFLGEEGIVDQQFGFSYGDEANSMLTAGATDFGFAGMILYPLLIVLMIRMAYEFFAVYFGPIPLLFIAFSLIFLFLQTEAVITGYFTAMRDAALFGIVLAIFTRMPEFRLRSN